MWQKGWGVFLDAMSTRRNRFYDEKGNRVSTRHLYQILLSAGLKGSYAITGGPCLPWIPFQVISRLKAILTRSCKVLEFGSGRSTVWLSRRSGSVVSIEDCRPWYDKVSLLLGKLKLNNVDYRFLAGEAYYSAASFADESFDLIIVDGSYRSKCLENAYSKLKAGGYIYLDNSDTDMESSTGDMRVAERILLGLSEVWSSPVEFYTGFSPGNLHAHQGALLRKGK